MLGQSTSLLCLALLLQVDPGLGCLCRLRSEAKSGDLGGKGERAGELDESGDGAGVKARSQNGTGWNFGTGAEKGVVAGNQTGNQAGEWAGAGAGGWDKTNLGEEAAGSWKGATKEGGFPHESFSNNSSSLPAYNNSGYEQQGKVVDLESGLQVYVVGEPDGRPCVIWNYDIRGFNGGRTRERCDELAAQGFMVILPDYFRGDVPEECGPGDFACWGALVPIMAANTNWTRLEADWNLVRSWAEEKGVTTFAAVGTCWGSYMTLRMSSLPEVVAGVSIHPSHSVMIPQLGEDEADILGQVEAPQLFLPTMTDSDNVKPGGLSETVLAEKGLEVSVVPFLTMRHGFLTRGDISDPEVAAEVSRAMNVTVDFIEKQFGNQ